jgi:HD-like signal output (HDOD) protein/predicted Ser/Thr protein kinase
MEQLGQTILSNPFVSPGSSHPDSAKNQLLAGLAANPRLPRPPAIVLRVLEKASQPDCPIQELADIVHHDPGLCGKFLQTVNSAIFGLRYPVASIDQALKMLGLRQVRSLALGLSLPAIFEQVTPGPAVEQYWSCSVGVAIVARELAVLRKRPAPADDLLAGLLCDLGTIVLQQAFPDRFAKLLLNSPDMLALQQCELEREILGIDHAEVSAYLLRAWRLPEDLTTPVYFHHIPRLAEGTSDAMAERTWILYFASQIANLQKGTLSPALYRALLTLAAGRFGMDEPGLITFLEPLGKKVEEFAALLKVGIGPCVNYAGLFASATQELARLSIEASADQCRPRPEAPETALWRLLKTTERKLKQSTDRPQDSRQENNTATNGLARDRTPAADGEEDAGAGDLSLGEAEINLGQYKVIEVIGRGGMGVVFRAYDTSLRRHVAIKVLGPWLSDVDQNRQRFAREGQAAASVAHENVVTVYAVEESGELAYLVMEYVDGLSLEYRMISDPPLELKEIVQIAAQIAEGLEAAHSKNLIHRDIKPANILLMKDSLRVKITDFGLARPMDDIGMTEDGAVLGTPPFMSPEQARGDPLDCRSDLFSLGSVLYAMCVGEPPFGADHFHKILRRICDEPHPSLRKTNRPISNELIGIIDKLLAKDPDKRFQSAGEVAKLLRRHLFHLL